MPVIIEKYYPELTPWQLSQLSVVKDLYAEWNAKINVISRKDIASLYERHVLHSFSISKIIQFKPGTRILDVGTGGGFPGIPLAILFPECHFTLVDSIGKKIRVVEDVAKTLRLENVTAIQARAEDVDEKFHFVVSRAVTEFPVFYHWVKDNISSEQFNDLSNGILYLKGGDLREELGNMYSRCTIYELKDHFEEEFFSTKKIVYLPVKKR